jgi:hypothetical protein
LLEQQQEKWKAIQKIRDEYYAARDAYREYDREARRIRKEKRAKEEKEFQEAKRRQIAQQKMGMSQASIPLMKRQMANHYATHRGGIAKGVHLRDFDL